MKIFTLCRQFPPGKIILTSDGQKIIGLSFCDPNYVDAGNGDDIPPLRQALDWLEAYFAGERPEIGNLPLAPGGSPFQREVWNILRRIPYGMLRTYGDIAKEISSLRQRPMSSQAVGQAVGRNPLAIIIPCHRVIGRNGNLTGYAAGLEIKIRLLEHEGVDMTSLHLPFAKNC